jgi:type IV pilus assembly protein PilB
MDRQRMGDLLARIGRLTPHDVDEILAEQRHRRQPFGQIAIALGFCEPEHVWAAWYSQLAGRIEAVDLDRIGIDAQATEFLPREFALGLPALPIRVAEGMLVVAISDPARATGVADLARRVGMEVRCVLAPAAQINRGLARYYPPLPAAG